jgi:hypothetical protein
MSKVLQYLLLFFFISLFPNKLYSADSISDKAKKVAKSTKYILIPPKIAKRKMEKALNEINTECCEVNFSLKEEIIEIKNNLQKCLNKKCYTFMIPLYNKKKPPLKLIVINSINKIDDLLFENQKLKYENLQKIINTKDKEKIITELKGEKNIEILKRNLKELEIENEKLQSSNTKLQLTVEKMLIRYEKRIALLESENEKLKNNFNKAYELVPKRFKNKFDKEITID